MCSTWIFLNSEKLPEVELKFASEVNQPKTTKDERATEDNSSYVEAELKASEPSSTFFGLLTYNQFGEFPSSKIWKDLRTRSKPPNRVDSLTYMLHEVGLYH